MKIQESRPQRILFSKSDAATMLSLSVRSVENLIRAGHLRARRIGSRTLVTRASLERLARRDVPSPTHVSKKQESDVEFKQTATT
jgi:excisionase family DNA binding protein